MVKNFEFKVAIKMQIDASQKEAFDKLRSWLETYGHTAAGHGFEFTSAAYPNKIFAPKAPKG